MEVIQLACFHLAIFPALFKRTIFPPFFCFFLPQCYSILLCSPLFVGNDSFVFEQNISNGFYCLLLGDDWEHEEIFTDDDEAVGNDPEEREDLAPEIPAPPEIKQVDLFTFSLFAC